MFLKIAQNCKVEKVWNLNGRALRSPAQLSPRIRREHQILQQNFRAVSHLEAPSDVTLFKSYHSKVFKGVSLHLIVSFLAATIRVQ